MLPISSPFILSVLIIATGTAILFAFAVVVGKIIKRNNGGVDDGHPEMDAVDEDVFM